MKYPGYDFTIKKLSEEDGGGYLITFPHLSGCMSGGETIEEAIENGCDAVKCYLEVLQSLPDRTGEHNERN